MKKNIYSLFLAIFALAGFTACSDSEDYKWADVPANAQVYFSKDLPAQQNISNKTNSFTIPVNRVKTDEAITVPVTLTSEDNFLSAPSSVAFAAGQATADLVLSYDPEALVYDKFKEATLSIADAGYTTPYGATSYTFKAGALSPYAPIGNGTLTEGYLWEYTVGVSIMQNQENKNMYKFKDTNLGIKKLDFNRDICLYSQTTMPLDEFRKIVDYVQQHISPDATFTYYDTICRQVANRMPNIRNFAIRHDVILFVCGKKSSNGRVLFNECRQANPRSYMIDTAGEIDIRWLHDCNSIGICGATSTPKWLMEECKIRIEELLGGDK